MRKRPILLVGDSPTGHSGLGRILRDVAVRIHENMGDVLDVATLGIGAPPSKNLPFMQYHASNVQDWVLEDLPYAWNDHAKDEEGIILFMWDISRLLWFAYPDQCKSIALREWRKTLKAKTWIYPAVDGSGPNGKLPTILSEALTKFDRVLNYTEFSAKITGYPDVCSHGIDTNVFYRSPNARQALSKFGVTLEPDEVLIGIVATNQPRKDWAMAFGALAELSKNGIKARVWIHTDTDLRNWDLKAMYVDFGLINSGIKVFLTPYGLPDSDMAMLYSACDVTMAPGVEGWGFPCGESLACGTPVIAGSYGGQADFVPKEFQVDPVAYRYEGIFAIQRPVYSSASFAESIGRVLDGPNDATYPVCSWDEVWPRWQRWIEVGI